MDKELISKRLIDLDKFINFLKEYREMSLEKLAKNFGNILAVERGLQISIQIVLDIGNHILAASGENNISEYSEIIERLGKKKVIPETFAKKIKKMAGLRNILVHEYVRVEIKEIYSILQKNLEDFTKFAEFIMIYILKS